MKKLFIILISALTVMIVLTACGPDTGNGDDSGIDKNDPLKDLKSYIEQSENPAEVKEYERHPVRQRQL